MIGDGRSWKKKKGPGHFALKIIFNATGCFVRWRTERIDHHDDNCPDNGWPTATARLLAIGRVVKGESVWI